jgi:hypothetical protein
MEAFGRRGGGAFAVLANEQMLERARQLREGLSDPGNLQRYETLVEQSRNDTTKGLARGTFQELNVALIELGTTALPMATDAVRGFSTALGWFTGGHKQREIPGWAPSWPERLHDKISPWNWMPWGNEGRGNSMLPPTPQPQSFSGEGMRPQNMDFLQGPQGETKVAPISLSLNVDGLRLAEVVSEQQAALSRYERVATDFNGAGSFG